MMKPAKRLLTAGMLALALLLAACAAPKEMPEDFQFSLVWNTYGISSYDSGTGVLIKTTDATHPENYETELHLSSDEMRAAWEIIAALDLADYPAEYDPNPDVKSKPGVTLVLSVFQGGTEKTIRCEDIALCHDAEGNKARARSLRLQSLHKAFSARGRRRGARVPWRRRTGL